MVSMPNDKKGSLQQPSQALFQSAPVLFVWLWSTGFIGAEYGLPYAEPFTLLLYRMVITLFCLGLLVWWMKPTWPAPNAIFHSAIAGLLVHGLYLGGVFYAIEGDMPAGLASLIVGLQPLVTAIAAVILLKESVSLRQWIGLGLGLVGVGLVLVEKIVKSDPLTGFPLWTIGWALVALLGISVGTVYQKRFGASVDLIPSTFIQYCSATIFFGLGAFAFETREVSWNLQLIIAMSWLVLGLSVGAILLLMQLIRKGGASQVASLFYLVPPVTALEAYILFNEKMGLLALFGGALAVTGVALVVIKRQHFQPRKHH